MTIYTCRDRTPYTYLLEWSKHSIRYYGVRYAAGCHPQDLFVTYFTSSAHVKKFISEHGHPDVIKIRKTFPSVAAAMSWEKKVLTKLDVRNNPQYLNKTSLGGYIPMPGEQNPMFGKTHSAEARKKISDARKASGVSTKGYTNEYRAKHNLKQIKGKPKGAVHSEAARKARSERLKGIPVHPNFTGPPAGWFHSCETKQKLKEMALLRSQGGHFCEVCNKQFKQQGKHNLSKSHILLTRQYLIKT